MDIKRLISAFAFSLVLILILSSCNLNINAADNSAGKDAPVESAEDAANQPESQALTTGEAPPEIVAALSEVSGDVQARPDETAEFTPAADGQELALNSQVQTGTDGRARIDFADGTIVRVAPESLFTLESVEESDVGLIKRLLMEAGQIWIILKGGEMEVDSESGVASVRGSEMLVVFDPVTGYYKVVCVGGICQLSDGTTTVTLLPGQSAVIASYGAEIVVGPADLSDLQAFLDNNPEAALVMGSVGNFVWHDLNGDGLQDPDEPGIAEAVVNLYYIDPSGAEVFFNSTFTDAAGFYNFAYLPGADYALEVIPPAGYIFTTPDTGSDALDSDFDPAVGKTAPFSLGAGENNDTFDAGLVEPQATGVCPFTGLPVEEGLLDLRPIGLSISHFPPKATRPPTGINWAPLVFEIFIGEGQTRLFSIFYCGYPDRVVTRNDYDPAQNTFPAIGDLVWHDSNQDGVQDPNEPGLRNVVVNLYSANQVKVASTQTDERGFYIFENVAPGEYYLKFNPPMEGYWTMPDAGGDDGLDSDVDHNGLTTHFTVDATDTYLNYIDAGLVAGEWSETRIEGVRSGRVIYVDIGKHFNAGLIYQGADPTVEAVIGDLKCASASSSNTGDIGSGGIDVTRLQNVADECKSSYDNSHLEVYKFGPPPDGGQPAAELLVFYNIFNQTNWVWDPALGGYVRWQNDIENPDVFTLSTDRLNSQPVVRQNVVVIMAPHNVLNAAGTIINVDLDYRQGPAWLFRDGMAFKICWSTLNADYPIASSSWQPILFTDCYGNLINLAYGSTWVNVMDETASVWDEGGGMWKARFYAP